LPREFCESLGFHEEEAVKWLLLDVQTQREAAHAAVMQAAQEVLQQSWLSIVQHLLYRSGFTY
jgi:hypothetical protein